MFKRPLVTFALIFCLGILFGACAHLNFWLVYSFAAAFAIFALFSRKRLFTIFILLVFLCLGILFTSNYEQLPACHIANYTPKRRNYCLIRGVVKDEPAIRNGKNRFILVANEVHLASRSLTCCGEVLVEVNKGELFRYGDELILGGTLYRVDARFREPRYREYLRNQGIHVFLGIGSPLQAVRLSGHKGNSLRHLALILKERIKGIIYRYLRPTYAPVLSAMVLGERQGLPPQVYQAMVKTGTVHILVVSGFNVGIISFIFVLFLKIFRIKRKARFYLIVPLLIIYCLITGAANPVVRATVMAITFLAAYLVKREPDIYNSCALAALFILACNPRQLFDLGFQLSFASVLAIVSLYPWLKTHLHLERWRIRPLRYLIEAALICLSAWLGTAALVLYNFHIFSPLAVVANLLIVPLATLIILSGLALIAIEPTLPLFAQAFAAVCEALISLLIILTHYFGR